MIFWMEAWLKAMAKAFAYLFAALPVMMIHIGKSEMTVPLIGRIDLGILYPILFVPIFITILPMDLTCLQVLMDWRLA